MHRTGNRLLDCLSPSLSGGIVKASRPIDLPLRFSLLVAGEVPSSLYLLTQGAASTVVSMAEGGSAEVGMVGNEGLVGAASLLGPAAAQSDTFMQLAGSGLKVPMKFMHDLFEESQEMRTHVLQFLQVQITISGQLSACNRLHEAEGRLARWLLTASDISQSEKLGLTQEFLAQMLGSQRTTVALVAGGLQRSGFIDYSRGTVRILDRPGLMSAACACYEVTRKAIATLYV
ncbi:MAG: Crp/Fnr family transcriptional regulator [Janthinobacterium lividum]